MGRFQTCILSPPVMSKRISRLALKNSQFAWIPAQTFYNNTRGADIIGPKANGKCSIHHWSNHGIAGRGILLDYRSYAEKKGVALDSYQADRISYAELEACGREQGIDIRPQAQGGDIQIGDMLFIRSGFIKTYYSKPGDERSQLARRHHEIGPNDQQLWAGVKQEEAMLDWLHDCYFATVAGDSPTFEAWPTNQGVSMSIFYPSVSSTNSNHQTITFTNTYLQCGAGKLQTRPEFTINNLIRSSQSSRRNGRPGIPCADM